MGEFNFNKDWIFNVLGIYNFNNPGKLSEYFKFIKENDKILDGNICEVGVYRGSSLISMALYLKKIKSDKIIYGFDTFQGFTKSMLNEKDRIENFKTMYEDKIISDEHFKQVRLNQELLELKMKDIKDPFDVSTSGDFSNTSIKWVDKLARYLKLDNIILIKGPFEDTMLNDNLKNIKFCSALIDCDLYTSYKISLPFIWSRLNKGGYIYLDEYYSLKFPGARIATDEFFNNKKQKPSMHKNSSRKFERWYVLK